MAGIMCIAPDIIILDEPTSGLDGTNMKMIAKVLIDMAQKGTMVLVITHDLELMGLACNCALSMPLSNEE